MYSSSAISPYVSIVMLSFDAGRDSKFNWLANSSSNRRKKGEDAKVAVRNIRRDGNDALKKLAKTEISEDEIKSMEDELQKLTDKYVKEISDMVEEKSKEVLTV